MKICLGTALVAGFRKGAENMGGAPQNLIEVEGLKSIHGGNMKGSLKCCQKYL